MAQVITIAGERLFALKAQNNEQLDIDTFIFANVPGQDPNATIDRNEGLPPVAQRVHQQIVQQVGRINDNVVVYSTVLDSVTGPFDFNWVGLYSSANQTLIAVSHIPNVSKTITVPGTAGNTLNRNFGIEYSGIADLAGITVQPETWQLDFTARLSGMDELTRQLAADMNGKDWFIGDGFKVVPRSTTNTFKVTPGAGYVSGLRIELKQDHILTLQSYPQFVYVDAWFDGDASSKWAPKTAFTVTNGEMDDYIDVNGKQHYVYKLARITAADVVEDLRTERIIASKYWVEEKLTIPQYHAKLINTAFEQLRKNKIITICCMGDSLTYGYDIYSENRLDGNIYGINGSKVDRASKQYPESLKRFLQKAYNSDQINVINRGYSGDTAATSYERWKTPSNADITIIMLGTNDANSSWGTKVTVAEFIDNYEKLIIREIQWGSAVVIALPPATSDGNNIATDIMSKALIQLASIYSLPIVDVSSFTDGYEKDSMDYGIYSDGTHFNGKGYEIIGARIASIFLGAQFSNPAVVSDSTLLCRKVSDGITLNNSYTSAIEGSFTPDNLVCVIQKDGRLTYSFYLTSDMYFYPIFWAASNSKVIVEVDFGVMRPKSKLDYKTDFTPGEQVYTYELNSNGTIKDEYDERGNKDAVVLGCGWHSISISNDINSSANVTFNALSLKKEKLVSMDQQEKIKGFHIILSHPSWSSTPSPVSTIRVPKKSLVDNLGINNIVDGVFYRNPLLKLTIEDDGSCFTYGYFYHLPNQGPSGGLSKANVLTVQTGTQPQSDPVLIDSITYDSQSEEFVINLIKSFARIFNITITVA